MQCQTGMAYNSYVILDDKVAVMDTVDANFNMNGWIILNRHWADVSRTI